VYSKWSAHVNPHSIWNAVFFSQSDMNRGKLNIMSTQKTWFQVALAAEAKARGLSQRRLAAHLGRPPGTIQRWLEGRRAIAFPDFLDVCARFNWSPSSMLPPHIREAVEAELAAQEVAPVEGKSDEKLPEELAPERAGSADQPIAAAQATSIVHINQRRSQPIRFHQGSGRRENEPASSTLPSSRDLPQLGGPDGRTTSNQGTLRGR